MCQVFYVKNLTLNVNKGIISSVRTRSKNSIATKVRTAVERSGPDRLWTYADFQSMPGAAVAAALSRLAKEGTLRRARKGVYYLPRKTRFGDTRPDSGRVAAAVLRRRGIAWRPTGPAAYNGLGLTTQVSPRLTFAVDRATRSLRVGAGAKVSFRLASAVRGLDARERAVLDALRDLRRIPDTSPSEAVRRIRHLFAEGRISFTRVALHALKEPPKVRALLGAIGSDLKGNRAILIKLRKSLNPTTIFRLNISDALPAARDWHIR
jgi:hypothetical protein